MIRLRTDNGKSGTRGAAGPVFVAIVLSLVLVAPTATRADTAIIYPPDGTAVTEPELTLKGVVTRSGEMPIMEVNGIKVVPFVKPDGTFEQHIKLVPGINVIQAKDHSIRVLLVDVGQVPADFVKRYVHPALEEGCDACHSLSGRGDLALTDEDPDLCLNCHDDPSAGVAVRHAALEDGCTMCHDPHVGETPRFHIMKLPDLCHECHDPVAEDKKVPHGPAEDGECSSCHNPHGSKYGKLLVVPAEQLCLECHDDPAAGAAVGHEAMDEGCQACHDPHGSATRSLLLDGQVPLCGQCHDVPPSGEDINGHSPISDDGECTACHQPHGGDGAHLMEQPPPGLCYDCHDDVLEAAGAGGSRHPPAEEGSCTDCHNPHGGPGALLVSPRICDDCHDTFGKPAGGSIHDPVEEAACVGCHSPHASSGGSLLKAEGTGLCYQCHFEFKGKVVHSPIADDDSCLECHRPHVAESRYLLEEDVMSVCLQCHDDPTATPGGQAPQTIHSPIVDDRECTGCHSPHAGKTTLLWEEQPVICYQCHDDMTRNQDRREFKYLHGPVAMGTCAACHQPHSSRGETLLDRTGLKLCLGCHEDPAFDRGGQLWRYGHPPVEENCGTCHDAHGSDTVAQVKAPIFDVCRTCHEEHPAHPLDASRAVEKQTTAARIPPLFPLTWDNKMVCTGCHLPHGSHNAVLLKTEKMVMCMNCH